MNLRDELNTANPTRVDPALEKVFFGEILNMLIAGESVTVPTATVGADIAAFTDPPSAAEMALLRTFVNALKADLAALRTAVISAGGVTEQAVTVTSSVATLANQPKALLSIIATTATVTGVKKLRIGPITGPQALVPATGEAVWDGGVKVLFSSIDAVTVANFRYSKAADATASVLQQELTS